jgi:hypothetical protein
MFGAVTPAFAGDSSAKSKRTYADVLDVKDI